MANNVTANASRNWKTTLGGILTLVFTGLAVYNNPAMLSDPTGQAMILGGISAGVTGLLAKDGDKTGVAIPPTTVTKE